MTVIAKGAATILAEGSASLDGELTVWTDRVAFLAKRGGHRLEIPMKALLEAQPTGGKGPLWFQHAGRRFAISGPVLPALEQTLSTIRDALIGKDARRWHATLIPPPLDPHARPTQVPPTRPAGVPQRPSQVAAAGQLFVTQDRLRFVASGKRAQSPDVPVAAMVSVEATQRPAPTLIVEAFGEKLHFRCPDPAARVAELARLMAGDVLVDETSARRGDAYASSGGLTFVPANGDPPLTFEAVSRTPDGQLGVLGGKILLAGGADAAAELFRSIPPAADPGQEYASQPANPPAGQTVAPPENRRGTFRAPVRGADPVSAMIPDAGRIILIDVSAEGFAFESNHPKETWTKGAAIAASFTFGGDVFEVKGVIVHAAKHPATSRWRYGVDLAGIRGVPAKKMSELVMELQRRELLRHRGTGD